MSEKVKESLQDKERKAKIAKHKEVVIIGVDAKKSKLVTGQEYTVSQELADVLVKAKRAKMK